MIRKLDSKSQSIPTTTLIVSSTIGEDRQSIAEQLGLMDWNSKDPTDEENECRTGKHTDGVNDTIRDVGCQPELFPATAFVSL